eukprot:1358193-Rhodomonas_salina.4
MRKERSGEAPRCRIGASPSGPLTSPPPPPPRPRPGSAPSSPSTSLSPQRPPPSSFPLVLSTLRLQTTCPLHPSLRLDPTTATEHWAGCGCVCLG